MGERERNRGKEGGLQGVADPLSESSPALYGGSGLEETTFPHQLSPKLPDPVTHPVCVCVQISSTSTTVRMCASTFLLGTCVRTFKSVCVCGVVRRSSPAN